MKNSEIREMPQNEIVEAIEEQKAKLFGLRATHSVSNLEHTHLLKSTKRLIARLKTELVKQQKVEEKNS